MRKMLSELEQENGRLRMEMERLSDLIDTRLRTAEDEARAWKAEAKRSEADRDEARKSVDELQDDLVNVVAADIAERDRYREAMVWAGKLAVEMEEHGDDYVFGFGESLTNIVRAALEPKESP